MRPFTDILGELAYGHTLDILTEDLAEVVNGVRETGKAGELTLKLTVKPNGAHGVAITERITSKVPRDDRGESLFFVDRDGGLHRNDPRQTELPLRQVHATDSDQLGEAG